MQLNRPEKLACLQLAEASIRWGLRHRAAPKVDDLQIEGVPSGRRATFVSLYVEDELNGCMGQLEPNRPLADDIASNAYGAAFRDPRFPPPREEHVDRLSLEVSILSALESLSVTTRQETKEAVEPGRHGVVLRRGSSRGTFLPSVWQKCPDPDRFLDALMEKAGIERGSWSSDIDVFRYEVHSFEGQSFGESSSREFEP
jgi:AmmeMemoRadiSam system protein A